MRKLSFLLLAGALFLGISCTPDIEDLYNRVDALEKQVADLSQLQSTVSGISTTVDALKGNVYVKSVNETDEGYVIEFTNGKTATIKNGNDGKDATAPTVGVKEVDGELVWTVNNEVVKDASGKPVPATVKVPEFKFDNNKWWYRFGANDTWKDCGEKTGPEPSITETEEFVIITIGDKSVQIPKEVVSPAIEAIKPVLNSLGNRLFVPVGESVDLKNFFEVEPEGALKSMVDYTPADDSPFTVTEKGILTCTGGGNKSVTVSSKANPDIKLTITVRSAECPNNETPVTTIDPAQKIMIFGGSLEDYNALNNMGGSSNFNPVNNSHTNAFSTTSNAAFNFRLAMPVEANSNLTMENARLHMWFYISDASVLDPGPTEDIDGEHFLEITSSGVHDSDEINFNLNSFIPTLKTGWNEVDLPFSIAGNLGGNFDITKTCFMRFVGKADTKGKWEAIQIRDYFIYVDDSKITAINPVLNSLGPRLFIPVGENVDLKDFFTVEPAKLKNKVTYTPAEGSPITVTEDGIVKTTEGCNSNVVVASKDNPDIKLTITIRSAECPNNETPVTTINPEQKIMIFGGSLEDYNALNNMGGSSNFNPVNNSHTNAFSTTSNAAFNFRLAMPVEANSNLTMENARLHMWFYISDASVLDPGPTEDIDGEHFLEITSSGVHDSDEINFNLNSFIPTLKTGWNEVDLPFSIAGNLGGNFDITKTCFMRFVGHANTNGKWEAIQIRDYFIYAKEAEVEANITIDGDLSDWAAVKAITDVCPDGERILEWKYASDTDNLYFYYKITKSKIKFGSGSYAWKSYIYIGFDTDNDPTSGHQGECNGVGTSDHGPVTEAGLEALALVFPWRGETEGSPEILKGVDENGKIECPYGTAIEGAHLTSAGKFEDSICYLEVSIPRAKINCTEAGKSITVNHAMDWYPTGRKQITLK